LGGQGAAGLTITPAALDPDPLVPIYKSTRFPFILMPRLNNKNRLSHIVFTFNNYVEEEAVPRLTELFEREAKYYVFGREVGESGTPHLQGYCSFSGRHSFEHVRNLLGPGIHFERAKGTARQNRIYCTKAGNYVEGGALNEGGVRPDKDELSREFIRSVGRGDSGISEFAEGNPHLWIHHGSNMLRNALALKPPEDRPNISVTWIWGPPGVGKSRKAHEDLPDAYIKDPRTKWWNGYLCTRNVIIDDFGPNGIDINHLLRWFDRYKCMVENKGGMLALLADTFIVTSNFHPRELFKLDGEIHPQVPALLRRLHVIHMQSLLEIPILNPYE